ncbi:MAG: RNB domain-containing ribonuclease, partial [Clostridia bacterium]|nr:RNB domain-containing ribonuclease [Clostridia bacterium]
PLTHTPLRGSDLAAVLREAEEKGKSGAVAYPLIRAQAKAVYQAEPSPHFGLGLALYCHFTSPIRRLADLATHRVIKAVLLHGAAPEKYSSFVRRAAAAASETELSAMNAERQMEDLFCALWATRHIGEKAEAVITQITGFGVFAALENSAEGLLSAEDLPYGAFLSPENLTLTLGKETYGLGDKLPIVIAEADVSRRRIRFCLQDAVPLFV